MTEVKWGVKTYIFLINDQWHPFILVKKKKSNFIEVLLISTFCNCLTFVRQILKLYKALVAI